MNFRILRDKEPYQIIKELFFDRAEAIDIKLDDLILRSGISERKFYRIKNNEYDLKLESIVKIDEYLFSLEKEMESLEYDATTTINSKSVS